MSNILGLICLLLFQACNALNNDDSFKESRMLGHHTSKDSDGKVIGEVSREELKETSKPAADYTEGAWVRVKNLLAQDEPELSITFCGLESSSTTEHTKEFCLVNKNLIKYGEEKTFYISKTDLAKISENSDRITWRFNDSKAKSFMHWSCYEHPSVKIDFNKLNELFVAVTQSNTRTYSCKTK